MYGERSAGNSNNQETTLSFAELEFDVSTSLDDGGEISVETLNTCQEDCNCSFGQGKEAEAFVNTLCAIFSPPSKFLRTSSKIHAGI